MVALSGLGWGSLAADEPDSSPRTGATVELSDDPRTIDPAAMMPERLAAKVSADLRQATLDELASWIKAEGGLDVLIDESAMPEIGLLPTDPVGDRLDDAPVYWMLNRLRFLGLGWYVSENIVQITSLERAGNHLTTVPYNIGDLLDAGYQVEELVQTIQETVDPATWNRTLGAGAITQIGDVMFIRQQDDVHRKSRGLLQALRSHGRQTFVSDPPEHIRLRSALSSNATVSFQQTPLESAIRQLGEQLDVEIRLDRMALRRAGVRDRAPVTLALKDSHLRTVLRAILDQWKLTWIVQDGVIWITTTPIEERYLKTAVYDVRDLCRDEAETQALVEAIAAQAADDWDNPDYDAAMSAPKPGVLVLRNTEDVLIETLRLLEAYRAALRESKPRKVEGRAPEDIVTIYYRLPTDVADGLRTVLPALVQPKTWKTAEQPDQVGTIVMTPSTAQRDTVMLESATTGTSSRDGRPAILVTPHSVLIITQTRGCHGEIADVITRVQVGDHDALMQGLDAGMGGLGGFGGGFF